MDYGRPDLADRLAAELRRRHAARPGAAPLRERCCRRIRRCARRPGAWEERLMPLTAGARAGAALARGLAPHLGADRRRSSHAPAARRRRGAGWRSGAASPASPASPRSAWRCCSPTRRRCRRRSSSCSRRPARPRAATAAGLARRQHQRRRRDAGRRGRSSLSPCSPTARSSCGPSRQAGTPRSLGVHARRAAARWRCAARSWPAPTRSPSPSSRPAARRPARRPGRRLRRQVHALTRPGAARSAAAAPAARAPAPRRSGSA